MDHCPSKVDREFLDYDGKLARLNGLARFESEVGLCAPLEESSSQDVVESDPGVPTPHIVSGNAQNLRPSKSWRPPPEAEASISSFPPAVSAAMIPPLLENPVQGTSRVDRAVNRVKRGLVAPAPRSV